MDESISGCFFYIRECSFFNFKTHQVLFLILALLQILRVVILAWGWVGVRESEREKDCMQLGWGAFGFLWCKMSHANSQRRIPVRLVMRWEVDQSQTWRYEAVAVTTQRGPELLIWILFVPSPTKLVFFWYLRLAVSWRILCIKLIPYSELRMIQTL